MAKTREPRRVRLNVYLLPKVIEYIDYLGGTGFYGNGARSQTAERLICLQIGAMINHPLFKDEFWRLNPQLGGQSNREARK